MRSRTVMPRTLRPNGFIDAFVQISLTVQPEASLDALFLSFNRVEQRRKLNSQWTRVFVSSSRKHCIEWETSLFVKELWDCSSDFWVRRKTESEIVLTADRAASLLSRDWSSRWLCSISSWNEKNTKGFVKRSRGASRRHFCFGQFSIGRFNGEFFVGLNFSSETIDVLQVS